MPFAATELISKGKCILYTGNVINIAEEQTDLTQNNNIQNICIFVSRGDDGTGSASQNTSCKVDVLYCIR